MLAQDLKNAKSEEKTPATGNLKTVSLKTNINKNSNNIKSNKVSSII